MVSGARSKAVGATVLTARVPMPRAHAARSSRGRPGAGEKTYGQYPGWPSHGPPPLTN
jgi:hypothetical protein